MSLNVEATPGHASANSFVTEEEQIAYMATRLNASSWTTFSGSTCTDNEKKAMISATRMLSAKRWRGEKVSSTQSLAWPRLNVVDVDTGWLIDSTAIPQWLKDATAELAFQFLNMGTTDLSALPDNSGKIEETVDVLTTRWDVWAQKSGLDRFPLVMDFIRPYLDGSGSTISLIRG